jgi:electron transfer flavoprotein alpha/beta subunit
MKYLVVILAFALASCTTTDVDVAIRQSLPQICAAAETGHQSFVTVATSGKIKQSTIDKEALAYGQMQVYCANKDTATLASTLVAAATAYGVIASALRTAQKVE